VIYWSGHKCVFSNFNCCSQLQFTILSFHPGPSPPNIFSMVQCVLWSVLPLSFRLEMKSQCWSIAQEKKSNVKFRSGNNCFAKFMPLSEELQNYQTFQLAELANTLQRKRCQPSVLTNCPDRKEGPFQGDNAGTIRVSSNITIRGLVTTMGNWGSFRLRMCRALKTS